jgi:hypothetical protein
MAKRVTILGMGPTAYERRHDMEAYCKGTEIWSLNNAYLTFPKLFKGKKFARFFELHSWNYLKTWSPGEGIDHFAHLNQAGCPVYTGQPMPGIENQVRTDWKAFAQYWNRKLFSKTAMKTELDDKTVSVYFKGSPSLMLAMALMEHDNGDKIDFIQSWGIDTCDPQHQCQRPSWSFWVGQAMARGIEIGGTMANYMLAPENDGGLNGLEAVLAGHIKQE